MEHRKSKGEICGAKHAHDWGFFCLLLLLRNREHAISQWAHFCSFSIPLAQYLKGANWAQDGIFSPITISYKHILINFAYKIVVLNLKFKVRFILDVLNKLSLLFCLTSYLLLFICELVFNLLSITVLVNYFCYFAKWLKQTELDYSSWSGEIQK